MSEICSCDDYALGNMGTPGCTPVAQETRRLILTRYFKDNGDIPAIVTADTIDAAFWNEHIQRYDNTGALVAADERWYITPDLENAEDVRADPVFQEFNSGAKAFVREGVRSMSYLIPNGTPELLAQILKFKCEEMGVWLVDMKDQVIGNGSVSGELRPIRIAKNSFHAMLVKATGGNTVQGIMITFDLHRLEYDHDLKLITADDMAVIPSELNPLIDVLGVISSVTTTGFVLTATARYGSFLGRLAIEGLVKADFVLTELSPTPGAITITSVTESTTTPGQYTFVIPTQTAADELKLVLKKVGLDGEALESLAITIP